MDPVVVRDVMLVAVLVNHGGQTLYLSQASVVSYYKRIYFE